MRTQALGAGLVAQTQFAMAPFRLHRPTTIEDALAIVSEHPDAVIAAGCSDLVAQIREGCAPNTLVSLQKVDALRAIRHEAGVLHIGPMVTHHMGATDEIVAAAIPNLATAWASIATVRIRYTATVGGNLMARRYRYEMPLLLGALDADLIYDAGALSRPVASLWADSGTAQRSVLTDITVRTDDLVWFGYERSMRPTATVALAVRRSPDGTLQVRAQSGSEYRHGFALTADTGASELDPLEVSAQLAQQLPDECADYTGSAEYRRHLVRVLTRRLLTAACAQLKGKTTR
ncbi:FAD binding domain-containing protein [Rhodococcus wratislaviensis]|nr:FAD binding domain-containing protein [Rhodococcus wratislaviensis]